MSRGDLALRIAMACYIAGALFFALAALTTPPPVVTMVQCAICFACAAGYAGLLILCRPA